MAAIESIIYFGFGFSDGTRLLMSYNVSAHQMSIRYLVSVSGTSVMGIRCISEDNGKMAMNSVKSCNLI